ncbi:taste receptor type 2 member 10-like [Anolis carolinensis]|uniref:taste receptor type 2 member 10-like n=1 Tax=Anolis carolinensis TaxID=28377 RepID=UPI002F2B3A33
MASPNYIAFLVIEVVLVISGLIFNGFIVMVMITQWIKYRRLASCEQLILSLGLSNLWVTIVFGLFHSAFSHESEFIVVSLCGHVCQMRSKESHLRSFQAKAHIQATWTVISLLLLFLSFFVAQTLSMTVDIGYNGKLFIFTVMSIYSPAQAVILVLNNPKLKQALAVMVQRTQS